MKAQLIKKCYDRGYLLTVKNKFYSDFLEKLFEILLKSDISKGDITTNSIFKKNFPVKAVIISKENGTVAGVEEISYLLNKYKIKTRIIKKDGSKIKKSNTILELKGNIKEILKIERTILNILQRMSGIATLTSNVVKKSKIKIASTRKTLYSYLDKKAVYVGNGLTHRLNLNDSILIKDNHLKYVDICEAIRKCKSPVEIEVTNTKQAIKAAKCFYFFNKKNIAIMFDNMKSSEIKKAIKKLNKNIFFEASGGININNIKEYEKTGVDVISLGYITKNSITLDISLELR